MSTGEKFTLYWERENGTYDTQGSDVGTATFFIDPRVLTKSVKTGKITINVTEYEDEFLEKKVNEDSIQVPISIDLTGPEISVSYNSTNNYITIGANDEMSGAKYIEYSTDKNPNYTVYSGPFQKPAGVKIIHVRTADRLDNVSTKDAAATDYGDVTATGLGGENGIQGTAFSSAVTYRTMDFIYYLFNGKQ